MQIREIPKDQLPLAAQVFMTALGEELGDVSLAAWIGYIELSHNLGGWLGDRLVGTATQYPADLTVPGNTTVPVHAVTGVGVLPTHTRRGIARGLMQAQVDHAVGTGAVAMVLEASEATIYGRFGYGPATIHQNAVIQTRHLRFQQPLHDDGSFEFATGDAIAEYAIPTHDAWRLTRPGQLSRPAQAWGITLVDVPEWRGGGGSLHWVFHLDSTGRPDGYVAYRTVTRWEGSVAAAEAKIMEVVAADPHVRLLLLRWVADVDLVEYLNINGLPVDDALPKVLVDPRRLRVPDVRDGLWVRLVDVPRALQSRRWWIPGSLVVEVDDPDLDVVAGRWAIEVAEGRASVTRTDAEADVRLGVAELGMLWLGGTSARALAEAGRVRGERESVDRATLLFAGVQAPNHVGEF